MSGYNRNLMEIPGNLISDSVFVQETFELLSRNGGRATFAEIADSVFQITNAAEELCALLITDLVRNDLRFNIEGKHLTINDEAEFRVLNKIDFVVLDVEAIAAVRLPVKIIELGAHRVQAGQITEQFQTLINPGITVPEFITTLTGISNAALELAPPFADVVRPWLEFAADAVLAAHNSAFDLSLLNREIGLVFPGYRMRNAELCTVKLARRLLPNLDSHNLDALAEYFGFEITQRHRAASDSFATARVLIRLLDQLETHGVRTLEHARNFSLKSKPEVVESREPELAFKI